MSDRWRKTEFGIPRRQLRAQGNLDYLGFIRVVKQMWEDSTGYDKSGVPNIELRASGTNVTNPSYPAIIYSLEMRQPMQMEPKSKFREIYADDGDNPPTIIKGQRFENIIKFTVITQTNPDGARQAEEIIELFEDFMFEFTPVFKELGLSDVFYARRFSDSEENRPGEGVVRRAVGYRVMTEKIHTTEVWRLQKALISARVASKLALETDTLNALPSGIIDLVTPDGFSDGDRFWIPNQWVGRIVEVFKRVQFQGEYTPGSSHLVLRESTASTSWIGWEITGPGIPIPDPTAVPPVAATAVVAVPASDQLVLSNALAASDPGGTGTQFPDDQYTILIPGYGSVAASGEIVSNTSSSVTLTEPWDVEPQAGWMYQIAGAVTVELEDDFGVS